MILSILRSVNSTISDELWGLDLFSNDFILGGLYEEMLGNVFDQVGEASVRDTNSRNMYLKNNCALVGN